MDELIQEFLAESTEGLDRMERCLTELEQRPHDLELVDEIFRAVHTIKGTTGFLGFGRLERVAHAGESLLSTLRDGLLTADGELISGLLQLMDALRSILELIERTGHEGERRDDDDRALIEMLVRLQPRAMPSAEEAEEQRVCTAEAVTAARHAGGAPVGPAAEAAPAVDATASSAVADKTLRIDVDVLNRMMNLVGELVLTRNQILQSSLDTATFPVLSRRLDAVTADLRETVMKARMQPVGNVFGKFPRMVRDLARSCGKQVRIEFSGESTGLDRGLLEAIKDPLTHAVRNAVDHGIETPERRLVQGKSAEGLIRLSAFHQSGSVVIELVDDGGGIPRDKVLAKALDRGLISTERAAEMSPREVLDLIFLPGFSTAGTVTTVSGRGVGMDVVRSNVEGAGGSVEVESEEGRGTLLRLRVPLTMAIVPALVVQSGGQNFCLPQGSLAELVYVPQREAASVVERVGEAELYRLREQLLPMIWLDRLLGIAGTAQQRAAQPSAQAHGFYLAVLEAEGCRYGLVVDDLLAPEEIVVKPLSPVLREIGLFSGATVLGNGKLAMILDIAATAARARVRPVLDEHVQRSAAAAPAESDDGRGATQPLLLIYEDFPAEPPGPALHLRERRAIPLIAVERIETISAGQVELVGGAMLLQYRGALLPLEDAGGVFARSLAHSRDAQITVLICERGAASSKEDRAQDGAPKEDRRRVGLIVERVVDIASGALLAPGAPVQPSDAPYGERLALVKERLVVLHAGFVQPIMPREHRTLKEVA